MYIVTETHSQHGMYETNVLLMPAKNPYIFGPALLDLFFTRQELSQSLLFDSTKSERVALDQTKVKIIGELIDVYAGMYIYIVSCIISIIMLTDIMNKRYNANE